MGLFKRENKSKTISIRVAPSKLEFLNKNKINKSKLFDEKVDEIILKAEPLIKFKKGRKRNE